MSKAITEFEILPDKNLRIVLLRGQKGTLRSIMNEDVSWDERWELVIQDQIDSGWWNIVRPEEVDALTSAPLLSDDAVWNDYGELTQCKNLWYYDMYAILDPIEELLECGEVVFTWGGENEEEAVCQDDQDM